MAAFAQAARPFAAATALAPTGAHLPAAPLAAHAAAAGPAAGVAAIASLTSQQQVAPPRRLDPSLACLPPLPPRPQQQPRQQHHRPAAPPAWGGGSGPRPNALGRVLDSMRPRGWTGAHGSSLLLPRAAGPMKTKGARGRASRASASSSTPLHPIFLDMDDAEAAPEAAPGGAAAAGQRAKPYGARPDNRRCGLSRHPTHPHSAALRPQHINQRLPHRCTHDDVACRTFVVLPPPPSPPPPLPQPRAANNTSRSSPMPCRYHTALQTSTPSLA